MVAHPQVDTSTLDHIKSLRQDHTELVKAVGRGQPALRDPSGNILALHPSSPVPTLVSQGHDVALRMGYGFLSVVDEGDQQFRGLYSDSVGTNEVQTGRVTGAADGRLQIKSDSGADVFFYWGGGNLNIGTGSSAVVSPLKSFVIDHPTNPDRYLVHVCTESPHAGVEYWGVATVEDGYAEIELPPYFEALTEPTGRIVQLTAVAEPDADDRKTLLRRTPRDTRRQGAVPPPPAVSAGPDWPLPPPAAAVTPSPSHNLWGSPPLMQATIPADGRFTIHATGAADTFRVMWLVKAIRRDVPPFDTEPAKNAGVVHGDGPYRYYVPNSGA